MSSRDSGVDVAGTGTFSSQFPNAGFIDVCHRHTAYSIFVLTFSYFRSMQNNFADLI